jgi:ATP-dependent exoDNAse (exonuclease V) alpha subunit
VLIVDEAAMVGTRLLARILDHADRAGAKVVLVGDTAQLPEIDAGGAFRGLAVRLGSVRLDENRRQVHQWEREALELLRVGDAGGAIGRYWQHNRVVVRASAPALRSQLVADWWAAMRRPEEQAPVMVAARFDELIHAPTRLAIVALLAEAVYRQGRYERAEELTRVSENASHLNDVFAHITWRRVRAKALLHPSDALAQLHLPGPHLASSRSAPNHRSRSA